MKKFGLVLSIVFLLGCLNGCAVEQIPQDKIKEAVKDPANAGVTVDSVYVKHPTYMYEPAEWDVVYLNVTKQDINENIAEITSESKIKNDDFEVEQILIQTFEKVDDDWTYKSTEEVISSHAKALRGVNYTDIASDVCIADLDSNSNAKIEFNEANQKCTVTLNENQDTWFMGLRGLRTIYFDFDGKRWSPSSDTFKVGIVTPVFGGKTIRGRNPDEIKAAFEYMLGSDKNSHSYDITFIDGGEKNMGIAVTYTETKYEQSKEESYGGFWGALHSGTGKTTSFSYKANYSGEYDLGSSSNGFGDDVTFNLNKTDGDPNMPEQIIGVFTYPDRNAETRVLTLSFNIDGDSEDVAFDLNPNSND